MSSDHSSSVTGQKPLVLTSVHALDSDPNLPSASKQNDPVASTSTTQQTHSSFPHSKPRPSLDHQKKHNQHGQNMSNSQHIHRNQKDTREQKARPSRRFSTIFNSIFSKKRSTQGGSSGLEANSVTPESSGTPGVVSSAGLIKPIPSASKAQQKPPTSAEPLVHPVHSSNTVHLAHINPPLEQPDNSNPPVNTSIPTDPASPTAKFEKGQEGVKEDKLTMEDVSKQDISKELKQLRYPKPIDLNSELDPAPVFTPLGSSEALPNSNLPDLQTKDLKTNSPTLNLEQTAGVRKSEVTDPVPILNAQDSVSKSRPEEPAKKPLETSLDKVPEASLDTKLLPNLSIVEPKDSESVTQSMSLLLQTEYGDINNADHSEQAEQVEESKKVQTSKQVKQGEEIKSFMNVKKDEIIDKNTCQPGITAHPNFLPSQIQPHAADSLTPSDLPPAITSTRATCVPSIPSGSTASPSLSSTASSSPLSSSPAKPRSRLSLLNLRRSRSSTLISVDRASTTSNTTNNSNSLKINGTNNSSDSVTNSTGTGGGPTSYPRSYTPSLSASSGSSMWILGKPTISKTFSENSSASTNTTITNTKYIKDDFHEDFKQLESDFYKFNSKTRVNKANMLRLSLLTFLRNKVGEDLSRRTMAASRSASSTSVKTHLFSRNRNENRYQDKHKFESTPSQTQNHTYTRCNQLSPQDLLKRTKVLEKWWSGLLAALKDREHPVAGSDRSAYLEAISGLMVRFEWIELCWEYEYSLPGSLKTFKNGPGFSNAEGNSNGGNHNNRASFQSLSSPSHSRLTSALDLSSLVKTYQRLLYETLAWTLTKLSLKNVATAIAAFTGKILAQCFFYAPGVAAPLLFMLRVNPEFIERVVAVSFSDSRPFNSFNLNSEASGLEEAKAQMQHLFPSHVAYLTGFTGDSNVPTNSRFAHNSKNRQTNIFSQRPQNPRYLMEIGGDLYGPWSRRWVKFDSDLFHSFFKHYYTALSKLMTTATRELNDFGTEYAQFWNQADDEGRSRIGSQAAILEDQNLHLVAPGLIILHAHILGGLDSVVRPVSKQTPPGLGAVSKPNMPLPNPLPFSKSMYVFIFIFLIFFVNN